jgi:hypothetical protein
MCKVLRAVESPFIGYNDLQEGFEGLWNNWLGPAEEPGTLQQTAQGRVEALRSP